MPIQKRDQHPPYFLNHHAEYVYNSMLIPPLGHSQNPWLLSHSDSLFIFDLHSVLSPHELQLGMLYHPWDFVLHVPSSTPTPTSSVSWQPIPNPSTHPSPVPCHWRLPSQSKWPHLISSVTLTHLHWTSSPSCRLLAAHNRSGEHGLHLSHLCPNG